MLTGMWGSGRLGRAEALKHRFSSCGVKQYCQYFPQTNLISDISIDCHRYMYGTGISSLLGQGSLNSHPSFYQYAFVIALLFSVPVLVTNKSKIYAYYLVRKGLFMSAAECTILVSSCILEVVMVLYMLGAYYISG